MPMPALYILPDIVTVDVAAVGLHSHCGKDAECEAGQRNSQCSKLLNICQCRSRQDRRSRRYQLMFSSARKGFIILNDKKKRPVSCVEDPKINSKNSFFVDPRMVGILVILALMFIIICVVLQMFSRYNPPAVVSERRKIGNLLSLP